MDTTYLINFATMTSALAVSVMLLVSALLGGEANKPLQRWFVLTVLLNILGVLCEFATGFLLGKPGAAIGLWLKILDFTIYVSAAPMNVTFALYLLAYLEAKGTSSRKLLLPIMVCSAVSIVLAAVSQYTGLYSFFDAGNQYHQGRLFGIAQIPPVLSLFMLLAITLRHRKSLTRREMATLLAYTLVPIVCAAIEVLAGGLWLSYFSASITLYLVYLNLQVETKRRMKEQEMALVESRTAMMVSQIQPHFIFNTLSAITRLCDNPQARGALTTFAGYLRVNMDSLSRTEPVPFSWELAHVREYLSLEGLRFEEKLAVVYDIQADQFMLPVLSVQPLVENAVRYGVMKRPAGGTITIRAEETGSSYRVTVLDDGVGFDPLAPRTGERSHTGIDNVRMRLKAMCGGTLAVQSTPGQGTSAIITIPKSREKAT